MKPKEVCDALRDTNTDRIQNGIMNTSMWIKIGEHPSRGVLREVVRKIRLKWVDRYDFQICERKDSPGFELHLRHR